MKVAAATVTALVVSFPTPSKSDDFSIGGPFSIEDLAIEDLAVVLDRPNKCCPNDYDCPKNAFRRSGQKCYEDYTDCICDYRYTMTPGDDGMGECVTEFFNGCRNAYQCPPNSWRDPNWNECYDSFAGCMCDYGYYKDFDTNECVPEPASEDGTCMKDIQCPKNGWRQGGRACWNSIEEDCLCDEYYELIDEQCKPVPSGPASCTGSTCEYECPPNSNLTPQLLCASSFSDCTCMDGYGVDGDTCVMCKICPDNSSPTSDCPVSTDDCACDEGYEKDGDKCVESCTTDYKCPTYSTRIPDLSCYKGIDDCVCDEGFTKFGNNCVAATCSLAKKPIGSCCTCNAECPSRKGCAMTADGQPKVCCPNGVYKVGGRRYCKPEVAERNDNKQNKDKNQRKNKQKNEAKQQRKDEKPNKDRKHE